MASIINADVTNGVVITSDTSGEIQLQANGVTKAKVTANGLQDANGNSLRGGSYRNLIINGDMRIAQRGTSATGINATGYYTADRMSTSYVNPSGVWTQTQDTDVPTGQGFTNSLKLQCTTASAVGTNERLALVHRFEGQMLQHLKKGTANAESLTLSFWVKSNKTGTYIISLYDADNIRSISKAYTINTANTWEKKVITFAGDTTGAFDNDNNQSFILFFGLAVGTFETSGTLQTEWGAITGVDRFVGQVNLQDSTSNYINITGVQLEVGENATPFENRMYSQELAMCQRYYYRITGAAGVSNHISMGYAQGSSGTSAIRGELVPKVTMRIYSPSVESASGTGYFSNSNSMGALVTWDSMIIGYAEGYGQSGVLIGNGTSVSGLTIGTAGYVRMSSTGGSNSWVALDAEL